MTSFQNTSIVRAKGSCLPGSHAGVQRDGNGGRSALRPRAQVDRGSTSRKRRGRHVAHLRLERRPIRIPRRPLPSQTSSRSLAKTSLTSAQSKPAFAAFLYLVGDRSSGEGSGNRVQGRVLRPPALHGFLDLVPLAYDGVRRGRVGVSEYVGVAAYQLVGQGIEALRYRETALLLVHLGHHGHEEI